MKFAESVKSWIRGLPPRRPAVAGRSFVDLLVDEYLAASNGQGAAQLESFRVVAKSFLRHHPVVSFRQMASEGQPAGDLLLTLDGVREPVRLRS